MHQREHEQYILAAQAAEHLTVSVESRLYDVSGYMRSQTQDTYGAVGDRVRVGKRPVQGSRGFVHNVRNEFDHGRRFAND